MHHYLITGGTGLIGSALCKQLIADNYQVTVLTRQPENIATLCGGKVNAVNSLDQIIADIAIDVVINLAGAPVAEKRWTTERKSILETSRVKLTQDLLSWLAERDQKPECLINASAVGWYGDGGEKILTEQSDFVDDYPHHLCELWEQQALAANNLGIRVCIVRIGLVLAANGGFLQKMLLPFKLGLGGRLGDGKQYMSWIHLDDIVNLFQFLVTNKQLDGVFNGTSPNPVTNLSFTEQLAEKLNKPALLPLPNWLLKIIFAEMSCLFLASQQVLPEKALNQGFQFKFTDFKLALTDVLTKKN